MKNTIITLCAVAAALALFSGSAATAAPIHKVVVPDMGQMQVMHDAAGIPIWGYGTRGRAIYAYSPEGLPVYSFERVYSGCYVPTWDFLPSYRGPQWPRGIHRKGHKNFRPAPGAPAPGGHGGHGGHGAHHQPAPGGHGGHGAHHQPAPGGHGGHGANKPGHRR